MPVSRSNKGFSLVELAVAVVIIGLLAGAAIMNFARVFEKARADEAKQALWEIRVAWGQYAMNHRAGPSGVQHIRLPQIDPQEDLFPRACRSDKYFHYSLTDDHAIATRCRSNGKPPQGRDAYQVTISLVNGTWGGTPGYY
jgi:prepilin-type N-terminal cleavage/methylation domain-containing protein